VEGRTQIFNYMILLYNYAKSCSGTKLAR